MLHRRIRGRLAGHDWIGYRGHPAVRPARFSTGGQTATRRRTQGKWRDVTTDSPWEKAKRRGSQPVGAFAVQEALRQVGPFELQTPDSPWGQRAFSWLLFS